MQQQQSVDIVTSNGKITVNKQLKAVKKNNKNRCILLGKSTEKFEQIQYFL